MLHQRVDKIGTAVDQDVLTRLLFQLGYFFYDTLRVFNQVGIVPLRLFQGRRNNVFGEAVDSVSKFTRPGGPGGYKNFI